MLPKEVHCVYPFLKERSMSEAEYRGIAATCRFMQGGITFQGISIEEMSRLIGETCRHMMFRVKQFDLDGKKVMYLAGESLGEKACYLLTVVVHEYKGLTQVVLRAYSDSQYGLSGFMNEITGSLRHLAGSLLSAKEIGKMCNMK